MNLDKLRILIVDDHAVVRAGIRSFLNDQPDFEIVGEASNGEEAIEKAVLLKPNLVLMDIALPGMSGIEATEKLKSLSPHIRVLVLTMHDDVEFFFAMLRAGASGYILKHSEPQQLLHAIRQVADDKAYLSPPLAKALVEGYVTVAKDRMSGKYESLSSREKEVLQMVARGMTNREIAESMCLSIRTVEKYRQALMRKLDLVTTEDLNKYAVYKGLIGVGLDFYLNNN